MGDFATDRASAHPKSLVDLSISPLLLTSRTASASHCRTLNTEWGCVLHQVGYQYPKRQTPCPYTRHELRMKQEVLVNSGKSVNIHMSCWSKKLNNIRKMC
eukprot:4918158-Amphidinium_carterae.1